MYYFKSGQSINQYKPFPSIDFLRASIVNHYEKKSDEELAELSTDSEQAFHALIKRYEKKMLVYISRSTGGAPELSEDILQETFLKVYKNLNGFDSSLIFSSWLYRIAHNEIVNAHRKNKKDMLTDSMETALYSDGLPAFISETVDISEVIISDEKILKIKELLFTLPTKYQDIIVLRYLEEKDYNEISDILKIPMGTVATQINRAKKKLKKIINKKHQWLGEND